VQSAEVGLILLGLLFEDEEEGEADGGGCCNDADG
jgi:hypothetical protein